MQDQTFRCAFHFDEECQMHRSAKHTQYIDNFSVLPIQNDRCTLSEWGQSANILDLSVHIWPCVVSYNIVYPLHAWSRYTEHFVIIFYVYVRRQFESSSLFHAHPNIFASMPIHSHVRQLHAQHLTLVCIRYAHTTCQIIVTTFLRQDSADRTKRNVLETVTGCEG